MKWRDWLEQWGMTSLKIKVGILETEWRPQDPDRNAAWEMYIELLTRIATQPLPDTAGDDATALKSVYQLFPTTREVLRRHGRGALEFAKLAVVILNQKVRPFTAKWHGIQEGGKLPQHHSEFRRELAELQQVLMIYTRMLGEMAGVEEDLTAIEG
jgi:hypothetical protein